MQPEKIARLAQSITDNISSAVFGREQQLKLIVTALLCGGHLLLDDVPGTGKTTLAGALARSLGGSCSRIQFTPDLLPSDITGINYYNQKTGDFVFRRGPLFANIIIADEINRTTPRTQSALLECMQERQITVDGVTYPLERPFMVIATQNPVESQGTFPLPEAQLDRFFMRLSPGYPAFAAERRILDDYITDNPFARLKPVCAAAELVSASEEVRQVTVSDAVRDYIVRISVATRSSERIRLGVSPRATLTLMHAAQAYAAVSGRGYVLPDDIKALAVPVLAHRIISRSQNTIRLSDSNDSIIDYIIESVSAPIE